MTLEPILSGKDIFAQAETGSGKTCAFVIPILEQILRDEKDGAIESHESRYVVLSPTRELAQQTHKVFQQFGKKLGIESCCIIGGDSIEKQKTIISKGVHVLVATPGRMTDLIKQKVISLDHCCGVVFDEADRIFDMGFKKDIEFILSKTASNRQLIMLSATSNQDVLRTAYKFNSHPEELRLNEDSLIVDHIDHKLAMVSQEEKFPLLVQTLREKENAYAIVFCNTQFQTHTIAEWLILMGFKAKPISGRLAQNKRTQLMSEFREKKVTILVCTDVAARGLDIKNVNLVINYDLPQEAANYVHRIGRTGRAGEEGQAISFCAHEDCEYLDDIYDLIPEKIPKIKLSNDDFATDICRKPWIDRKTLKVGTPDGYKGKNERVPRKSAEKQTKKPIQKTKTTTNATEKPFTKNTQTEKVSERSRPRVDKRFLELEGYGISSVKKQAMDYFKISDEGLLGFDILSEGGRRFLLFGAKKTKFKFFVKPIYHKILLPFLINVLKTANLDLYAKVSYKPGSLHIKFSGKDEKLLIENRFELLNAFEHLIKTYLQARVVLHRNLKIQVRCFKKNDNPILDTRPRRDSRELNEKELIKQANFAKKKALASNKPFKLKPMNAAERRIIHQHFESDKEVKTSSIGNSRLKQIQLDLR